MKRLIWKELRENIWMMGVTLVVSVMLILFYCYRGNSFPLSPSDLVLVNIMFAVWGALQSSHKKERSIQFLPLRWWNTALIRLSIGTIWVWFCAALMCLVGYHFSVSISVYSFFYVSGMVLSYTVALLAGMLWNAGFSGILGAVVGVFGWKYLANPYFLTHEDMRYFTASTSGLCLVLSCMVIVFACLKTRAYSIKSLRIAAIICVALLVVAIQYGGGIDTAADIKHGQFKACESHLLGRVAYVTDGYEVEIITGYRTRSRRTYKLHTADIDGKNSKIIARGYWAYPILWAANGELIYTKSVGKKFISRLCAWSTHTGTSRVITDLPIISTGIDGKAIFGVNGEYLAIVCVKRNVLNQPKWDDLWIINLNTGAKRLAYPYIELDIQPIVRKGKLYLRQYNEWTEISFEGGLAHQVSALPEMTGVE